MSNKPVLNKLARIYLKGFQRGTFDSDELKAAAILVLDNPTATPSQKKKARAVAEAYKAYVLERS